MAVKLLHSYERDGVPVAVGEDETGAAFYRISTYSWQPDHHSSREYEYREIARLSRALQQNTVPDPGPLMDGEGGEGKR